MIAQINILKEYENIINILIHLIEDKDSKDKDTHYDIQTPVQRVNYIFFKEILDKIDRIENENFELKKRLVNESLENKKNNLVLNQLLEDEKLIDTEITENDSNKLRFECKQIILNINSITDELDSSSHRKNILERENQCAIIELQKELNCLIADNKELKEILNNDKLRNIKRKKIIDSYSNCTYSSKINDIDINKVYVTKESKKNIRNLEIHKSLSAFNSYSMDQNTFDVK